MKLIPEVKKIQIKDGILSKNFVAPYAADIDGRIKKATDKLPLGDGGVQLVISMGDTESEKYTLEITKEKIIIDAAGIKGAFYAIQTLRQIFLWDEIPCLYIEDEPDFEYRGLYHDVTRGKIPTVETIKKLIDDMAYFKMNSLQLYVEHVFEFEETKELIQKTGYLTKEEIKELDSYCAENFVEFIPSIATFGHMFEILEQDKYKHLRVCKDIPTPHNFWRSRMAHHTIDPQNPESTELVYSLIDQYEPLFRTDKFNICGDETFDLEKSSEDAGKLYVDFVRKIIEHIQSKNKKVMMWADILLKHPETLEVLPDDIYYLNWEYGENPSEENVRKLSELGKKQIVCPGTSSWSRLCENVNKEEENITRLIEYGHKHGAIGVLNTNWGDYANPASIELAMYGIVLGGAKSWNVNTKTDKDFYEAVNLLLYGNSRGMEYLKRLSDAHSAVALNWNGICSKYFEHRYGEKPTINMFFNPQEISSVQSECLNIVKELKNQVWQKDEYRQEMLLCAEGICVLAHLGGKLFGGKSDAVTDAVQWLCRYKEKWLTKNKESEISKIEEMICYLDRI